MNFMEQTEFLLLMNHDRYRTMDEPDPYHVLTTAEKELLYNVGIRTAHEQPAWSHIEPFRGAYDYGYLGGIIQSNRDAGLKSLVQLSGWRNPKWMPDEWFAKTADGKIERECLSMWNEEAQEHSDKFYRDMVSFYASQKDVALFFGEFQGGEGVYFPTWCLFDNAALEDYKKTYGSDARPEPGNPETLEWFGAKAVEHLLRKNRILQPMWNEIWNEQQYLMDTWTKSFGNFTHDTIMKRYREEYPDACIVLLQYTYSDPAHTKACKDWVDYLVEISQCEVIVEAMFCGGLRITTPNAISKNFRGQIVHPAKDCFATGILEPWMINEIGWAHDQWMKAYEHNGAN